MSSQPYTVTVVVPCLNSGSTIEPQLYALAQQTCQSRYEVVVVDNGSTDDTVERVSAVCEKYAHFRLTHASGPKSANRARNHGVAQSTAPYILFTDADDIVDSAWVSHMAAGLDTFSMVGGFIEESTLNTEETLRGVDLRSTTDLTIAHSLLPMAIGTNLGIRRSVLDAVGGWYEGFPGAAGDDVELSWRVQLRGYSLGKAEDSIVHYRHRASILALMKQQFRRGRNSSSLCRAYRPIAARAAVTKEQGPQRLRSNLEIAKEGLAMIVRSFVDEGARRRTLWLAAGAMGWAITDLLHYLPGDDKIESGIKQLWDQLEKNDTPHEALV